MVWGGINGGFILSERWVINRKVYQEKREGGRLQTVLKHLYMLFVVNIGWIFFRAPNTRDAMKYVATMFGVLKPERIDFTVYWYLNRWTIMTMITAVLSSSSVPNKIGILIMDHTSKNFVIIAKYMLLIALLYLSMLRIVSDTYNPFIYFQF